MDKVTTILFGICVVILLTVTLIGIIGGWSFILEKVIG
ncbi:hypothetical protein LCGC14_3007890 [marine sediment metagenome]|uniref:Uncharacterized protein n=1 Tax=marine sediment metagenome TaxID=412755 RepID=A0A0F8XLV1_9ZZZZ